MKLLDQQQQPWILSLRAKSKNLDFKLKFSKVLPLCKLSQFSIQFKLHHYAFEIKSKPKSSFSLKPKSLKFKFLQIFKNFHRKRSENKGIVRSWCAHKNYFYGRRKNRIWLWVLLFAVVGGFMIMQLSYYLGGRFVWKCSWRAWNYAAASGIFYPFFKFLVTWRRNKEAEATIMRSYVHHLCGSNKEKKRGK